MEGMRRIFLLAFALLVGLGLALGLRFLGPRAKRLPDPAAVAVQIREVARLEALDISLYKKLTYSPDPSPSDSFWDDVVGWARHTFATPTGKAIVFADARLGIDLEQLGPHRIQVSGRSVFVVLPPIKVAIELKPGETEIIGSNLNSKETAELLDLAKTAFEREVRASPQLLRKAQAAAERAITSLLSVLGFTEVRFVDVLPGTPKV
jgi:hypothetical protein